MDWMELPVSRWAFIHSKQRSFTSCLKTVWDLLFEKQSCWYFLSLYNKPYAPRNKLNGQIAWEKGTSLITALPTLRNVCVLTHATIKEAFVHMTCVEQYLYFYQFYWKPEGGDTKGLCGALRGCVSYLIFYLQKFLYLRCVLVNNLFWSRASNLKLSLIPGYPRSKREYRATRS